MRSFLLLALLSVASAEANFFQWLVGLPQVRNFTTRSSERHSGPAPEGRHSSSSVSSSPQRPHLCVQQPYNSLSEGLPCNGRGQSVTRKTTSSGSEPSSSTTRPLPRPRCCIARHRQIHGRSEPLSSTIRPLQSSMLLCTPKRLTLTRRLGSLDT